MTQQPSPLSRLLKRMRLSLYKQDFDPGLLGLVSNNAYHSRKGLIGFVRSVAHEVNGLVLDVGSGSKPYEPLFNHNGYFGIDIENPGHSHEDEQIDIYYDGVTLPFADHSMDSVVCFEVMEHVQDINHFLGEINRVLKPGGTYLATMPFMWEEHEQPNDFRRFTRFGMDDVLASNGFEVKSCHQITKGWPALFTHMNSLVAVAWRDQTNIPLKALLWAAGRLPVAIFNTLGLVMSLLPAGNSLYLNNGVVARKRG